MPTPAAITKPGIYDVADATYHRDNFLPAPSLSASIIKILDQETPAHAHESHPRLNPDFEEEHSERFDIGKAVHEAVLRGDDARFCVIEAEDYRKKAAQEERDVARLAGLIPLLPHQRDAVFLIERSMRAQLSRHTEAQHAFEGGRPEQTLVWQERGVWARCKPDWLPDRRRFLFDLKSTEGSAAPESWMRRNFYALGYDIQAAWYLRGVKAVLGWEDAQFGFVVVETKPPFAISVVGVTPEILSLANRKIDHALALWARCLARNEWPMYEPRIYWPAEIPPWEAARVEAWEPPTEAEKQGTKELYRP